ncbi:MAG: hypothetical protein J6J64_04995 [Alistipes sp.]|nr:hypothetical protein [Alistipes sp.]
MELKKIEDRLSRLVAMVEGWSDLERVPLIERDIVLEELRHIYVELLDGEAVSVTRDEAESLASEVASVAQSVVAEQESGGSAEDLGDAFDDALDIDALLGLDSSDKPVEPVEPEVEPLVEPEPISEPEPEPIEVTEPEPIAEPEPIVEPEPIAEPEPVAEPEPEPTPEPKRGGGLFDIEDIPVRTKSGRRMIALYNTPPRPVEPKSEPKPGVQREEPDQRVQREGPDQRVQRDELTLEPESMETFVDNAAEDSPAEPPKRLADVLGSGVTVLGDKMSSDDAPTTPFNRIDDIRKAIGLNDKFLMIRDLFGGDAQKFEDTIDTLNEFEDLDECMIYIVENFRWNPDSDGAKLLVSLIERKLA